jgi:hypothetical protein
VLARSFGTRPGWFWWSCRRGFLPDGLPTGPFATSYAAYRNIASRWMTTQIATSFGHRWRTYVAAANECESSDLQGATMRPKPSLTK